MLYFTMLALLRGVQAREQTKQKSLKMSYLSQDCALWQWNAHIQHAFYFLLRQYNSLCISFQAIFKVKRNCLESESKEGPLLLNTGMN